MKVFSKCFHIWDLRLFCNTHALLNSWCRRFIRRCKQGCLQFVILKPILAAVTLILYAKGKYKDGNFSPNQSYLYLTIIYTLSYTMALYALALFYVACKDLLQPFNPVPKFIIIKSVVFLTYWQVKTVHIVLFYMLRTFYQIWSLYYFNGINLDLVVNNYMQVESMRKRSKECWPRLILIAWYF